MHHYMKFFIKTISFVVFTLVAFSSCKEDINYLESDLIGGHNFSGVIDSTTSVVAYSKRTFPVQTNDLPIYRLGVYNDAVFGQSTANLLTQVSMEVTNPTFGIDPVVEKVILSIPYFSTSSFDGEDTNYTLDSIYGNAPIRLSVYESNYFLRNLDPQTGFEEPQKYYSNQNIIFENFLGQLLYETDDFVPSNEGIDIEEDELDDEGNPIITTLSPRLYIELSEDANAFFTQKILQQEGSNDLLNNNNFRDYFRGIYIKTEPVNGTGNAFVFSLADAKIEIEYSYTPETTDDDEEDDDDDEEERATAKYNLALSGVSVNTINTAIPGAIQNTLDNPNTKLGEENLYLKGGDGAITVIELFGEDTDGDGEPDKLTELKNKNILVNDAYLQFYVNRDAVSGGNSEPDRIFIFDLENKKVLIDYTLDTYTPQNDLLNYKSSHLGRLERDSDNRGVKYKIRLTNYINSLINKDSTNLKLGLSVSQNVVVANFKDVQNTTPPGFKNIPTTSVISPKGTVLYGPAATDPEKRVKLFILYTEINN